MDNLEFLDAGEPASEAKQPVEAPTVEAGQPTPEAPAEAQPSQPRGVDGRFAPKEAAPEPQPAPPVAAEPVAEKPAVPPGFVPVGVVQELRDEIRSLKAPAQPRPQPEAVPMPDPIDDPEGFAQYQNNLVQERIYATNLNWSRRVNEIQHGKELIGKVLEWGVAKCDEDPYFNARLKASDDPVGEALAEYQRTQIDPSKWQEFVAWQQAQAALASPQPAAPAAPPQPVATPPVSIASAPSAGGVQHQAVGPGVAFDETIR